MVLPFKWKLFCRTFEQYYLNLRNLQKNKLNFLWIFYFSSYWEWKGSNVNALTLEASLVSCTDWTPASVAEHQQVCWQNFCLTALRWWSVSIPGDLWLASHTLRSTLNFLWCAQLPEKRIQQDCINLYWGTWKRKALYDKHLNHYQSQFWTHVMYKFNFSVCAQNSGVWLFKQY